LLDTGWTAKAAIQHRDSGERDREKPDFLVYPPFGSLLTCPRVRDDADIGRSS